MGSQKILVPFACVGAFIGHYRGSGTWLHIEELALRRSSFGDNWDFSWSKLLPWRCDVYCVRSRYSLAHYGSPIVS